MNMFTVQILQILLKSGSVRLQTLMDQSGTHRRMVLYYQKQLNDYLQKKILAARFFQDDALFLASSDMQKIPEILEALDLNQYYLEASERQECILLKIGISGKPQFLEALTEEFHVSRRTLTNDLICIKEQLIQHNIHLLSRQKQGYYLSGDEWMIRYLLLSAYHRRTNLCIDRIKKNLLLEAYQYYCAEAAQDRIFERLRLSLSTAKRTAENVLSTFLCPIWHRACCSSACAVKGICLPSHGQFPSFYRIPALHRTAALRAWS